jgi:hypothetical protein
MTTVVRADAKGRLCIRGTQEGAEYLVQSDSLGWRITPMTTEQPKRRPRRWPGAKTSLAQHLADLADRGLTLDQAPNAGDTVGPCRF